MHERATVAKRDNQAAARALADAVLTDDRTAAAKHGIIDRTLRRNRKALDTDPELSASFRITLDAVLTQSCVDAGSAPRWNQATAATPRA